MYSACCVCTLLVIHVCMYCACDACKHKCSIHGANNRCTTYVCITERSPPNAEQIRSYLSSYVEYVREELKKVLCTAKTVKFAFEDFSSFEQENFLENTKEHIMRLFFNSMVDYFGLRIQDRVHYTCVRDYMAHLAATQIEAATRPFLLYLGRLQLLVKVLSEMEQFLQRLMETDLSISCVRELTRMKYCPLCSGHICVRPCREYCHDTVLQCTKDIRANLHVILELRRLFEDLWLNLASSDAMINLPSFIIDVFLPFLEANADEILNKVFVFCGHTH